MKNICMLLAGAGLMASPALATDFSYTGTFTADDNVAFFTFSVGAASTVTLRTFSYAGGVNAAGQTISAGGFDPILALYDTATGNLIDQNDDGGSAVPADATTGARFDTLFSAILAAGNYTVAVSQYDNFGPANLALAFPHAGQPNFTSGFTGCMQPMFCDVANGNRDGHWAFDILNVDTATGPTGDVPEPATWAMMLVGFGGMGYAMRRRRQVAVTFG